MLAPVLALLFRRLAAPLASALVLGVAPSVFAQAPGGPTPPPLVQVGPPPPMPPPEPAPGVRQSDAIASPATNPGTPPPPSAASSLPGAQPSYPGYPYSPYGSPSAREAPGPEIGMMITESLFGMLTAGATLVLPYILFSLTGLTADATMGNVMLIALMVATPFATANAQVGIASGSFHYRIESWVPMLAGLLGDALVFGTYLMWNGGISQPPPSLFPSSSGAAGGVPPGVAPQIIYLLVAASAAVPLLQMAAINIFKQPRLRPYARASAASRTGGVTLEPPMAHPILTPTASGTSLGLGLALLRGTF